MTGQENKPDTNPALSGRLESESPSADIKKVIVAVHGIGDQTSYATIQSALFQFCQFFGAPPAVPLGQFHTNAKVPLTLVVPPFPDAFKSLAFAEVYWANIPRENAKTYSLEQAQKWAMTIVQRVRQRGHEATTQQHGMGKSAGETAGKDQLEKNGGAHPALSEEDYPILEQVLTEMLQTVGVLDRLCYLADKAGVFTFDLNKVLVDYLDDVQVVTEFQTLRTEILKAFDDSMQEVYTSNKDADIYIVAHSEGTVVSFLGLLDAMCSAETPDWIRKVRGFMTIGSPIDKHLILWPELFGNYRAPKFEPRKPIEWRNYYDKGDPIGFNLDTIRKWLRGEWGDFTHKWSAFHFEDDCDFGFTRYPFPGKAHNDYWTDDAVFGHFIRTVLNEKPAPPPAKKKVDYTKPPGDKRLKKYASYVLPYVGAFALLFVAVFVLYKAIDGYTDPDPDKGLSRQPTLGVFRIVISYTFLLAGLTVAARIPRLKRSLNWRLLGLSIFVVFALGFLWARGLGFLWVISIAVAVVTLTSLLYALRKGSPSPGTKTLLVIGAIGALIVVVWRMVKGGGEDHGALWPVGFAGIAFFYLWWLVILIFDLTFIWHRYIHTSDVMKYLHDIAEKQPRFSK
jgi:hypothetical protein